MPSLVGALPPPPSRPCRRFRPRFPPPRPPPGLLLGASVFIWPPRGSQPDQRRAQRNRLRENRGQAWVLRTPLAALVTSMSHLVLRPDTILHSRRQTDGTGEATLPSMDPLSRRE